jgi:hypothetical protein
MGSTDSVKSNIGGALGAEAAHELEPTQEPGKSGTSTSAAETRDILAEEPSKSMLNDNTATQSLKKSKPEFREPENFFYAAELLPA